MAASAHEDRTTGESVDALETCRQLLAVVLALLILAQSACMTSRHRPVSGSDPTWVTVRVPPAEAHILLMRQGQPLRYGRVTRVMRGTGEVVGAVVVVAAVVATVGVAFFVIAQHSGTSGDPIGGTGALVSSVAQVDGSHPSSGGTGGSDPGLNMALVCRDADTADLIDRQRVDGHSVALPLYAGQRGRLILELDDGVRMVEVPLAVVTATPGERVEITVNAGPDPAPMPTTATPPLQPSQP